MTIIKKTIQAVSLAILLGATSVAAQTTTATSTPGTPSTGMGGDMLVNLVVLAIAGAIAITAALYVLRKTQ